MIRIAICAPATPIKRKDAAAIEAMAAARGELDLRFHEQCFAGGGHFAGDDEVRLDALLECANDPGVDAVWFAKGGYGSNRIAARAIDGMDASAHTKTFLGYSDCGYLLAALYRAGVGRSVHAPMPSDIRREEGQTAIARVLDYLGGSEEGLEGGLEHRPAVAFNLYTLAMLVGTELMPELSGHEVLVEEVAEHLYAVDRLFFHITQHLAGTIAGLRLGRVTAVPENDRPFGSEAEAIARDWCARSGIPYLGRAGIGHDARNSIVPFGFVRRPN